MAKHRLKPRVRSDLRGIWRYTKTNWSRAQADRYIRELNAAIELIARDPDIGRPMDDIAPGYRRRSSGAHIIIFRVLGAVEITRVLHGSMDIAAHLQDDA